MALVAAWLRRVARSKHADRFVLRGSLLTSSWVPGRRAADVDHLVLGIGSVEAVRAMIDDVLAEPDEVPLPPATHEVIWAETEWPGLRTRALDLQIDVGWGDPLATPPAQRMIEGVSVWSVRPETMFAWKLHGLVEHGRGRWRAKDLLDLLLLHRHVALEPDALIASLSLAFSSRRTSLDELDRLLAGEWGRSRGSRRKWTKLRDTYQDLDLPEDLDLVVGELRPRVAALVTRAKSAVG